MITEAVWIVIDKHGDRGPYMGVWPTRVETKKHFLEAMGETNLLVGWKRFSRQGYQTVKAILAWEHNR